MAFIAAVPVIVAALPAIVNGAVLALTLAGAVITVVADGYTLYINMRTHKVEKIESPEGEKVIITDDGVMVDQDGTVVDPSSSRFQRFLNIAQRITSPEMVQKVIERCTEILNMTKDLGHAFMQAKDSLALITRKKGGCEGKRYNWACLVIALVAVVIIILIYQLNLEPATKALLYVGATVVAAGHAGVMYCLKPPCQCIGDP
jgi:hypothetical protein